MSVPILTLTAAQTSVVDLPLDRAIFLEGPAGTGKTTAAVARLLRLLRGRVRRLDLDPDAAAHPGGGLHRGAAPAGRAPGGEATVVTFGGLAQRMVELFWPQVAGPAGFAAPNRPPVFLTLETAQYYMARIVGPLLDDGYFDSIKVDRNRLYSQILDNLNKAAAVGFPHTEIAARLKAAWIGEPARRGSTTRRRSAPRGSGSIASPTTCWISPCSTRCLSTISGRCPPAEPISPAATPISSPTTSKKIRRSPTICWPNGCRAAGRRC